jgi:hypothetical protein
VEDLSRTLIALTEVISVNNKRAHTYHSVTEKTENPDLKPVFSHYEKQAKHFVNNLSNWRSAYGGFAVTDKKQNGSSWSLLSLLGRSKNMVSQCEQVEQESLKVYRSVLGLSIIPREALTDLQRQAREIEKAIEHLKSLKHQPEAAQQVAR